VFTEQQKAIALDRVRALWKNTRCEVCGQDSWALVDRLMEMREFQQGGALVAGGYVVPCVVVSCKTCGYVRLINAILAGIVDNETGAFIDEQ
jgi:hypothetical protein